MEFLNKIRDFVQDLEEKDFYKYLGITLLVFVAILSFMVYRYYSNVNYYKDLIEGGEGINEQREELVNILKRSAVVKRQKKEVDEILKKEEDFKIIGYFNDLLKKLKLSSYKKDENVMQKELDENYKMSELNARLVSMDMKQLCELLKELEDKKRINIKSLEIKRSQKKKGAIDVDIIISTLLPKASGTT